MKGYVSVSGSDGGELPVGSGIAVYRDPGETQQVLAATQHGEVRLGVTDVTVSRKSDGEPPIVIDRHSAALEVRNNGNSNALVVSMGGREFELEEGQAKRIKRDAEIAIGYQTTLLLEVEREARKEVNVGGDVSGDVVMGDNVDRSTSVVDSVVNRSDIGGDGGGTKGGGGGGAEVEDSVVNRSNVGGDATADRTTPSAGGEPGDERANPDPEPETGTDPPTDRSETKYCLYCGEEIPTVADVCPGCGESLPEH